MSDEKTEVPREFEYDVALSFAGTKAERAYVGKVADALKKNGVNVFYDKTEKVKVWGRYLDDYLAEVYDKARFVVIFLSREYVRRRWTLHELKSVLARLFREDRSYILPVRLDDVKIPWSLRGLGCLDLVRDPTPPRELAAQIRQKLEMQTDTPDERLRKRRIARRRRNIVTGVAAALVSGGVLWGFATHYNSHTSVERGAVTPRFIQVHLKNSGWQSSTAKGYQLVFGPTLQLPSPKELVAITQDVTKDRVPPAGSLRVRLKPIDDEILPKCAGGRYPTFRDLDRGANVHLNVYICESSGECKWIPSEVFHASDIKEFLGQAIPEKLPKRC